MNKTIFTLFILFLLSFSFTISAETTPSTSGSILDTLIPSRKNCNYVSDKQYEPFSDINANFPGAKTLTGGKPFIDKSKKNSSIDCVNVAGGTENLLKLLFTTAITIIIVLTVISISVAGIQFMTEQATGQIKGGAKKRLQNSFIALGLGLLSYTILYTVNKQLVNFTFNPVSIDIKGSIRSGINDANIAALSSGASAQLVDTTTGQLTTQNFPISPTGYVNKLTGQPCVGQSATFVGPPDPNCLQQNTTQPGGATGNFGSWNETTADSWVRSQINGPRSTDGRLIISTYTKTGDKTPDGGSRAGRGNSENLLREGSVAFSPNLIEQKHPKLGQEVFVNGTSVGFFEDTSGSSYGGMSIVNTIDVYDENRTLGVILKNIPPGQWNLTLGSNIRPQIPNPSPKR